LWNNVAELYELVNDRRALHVGVHLVFLVFWSVTGIENKTHETHFCEFLQLCTGELAECGFIYVEFFWI